MHCEYNMAAGLEFCGLSCAAYSKFCDLVWELQLCKETKLASVYHHRSNSAALGYL